VRVGGEIGCVSRGCAWVMRVCLYVCVVVGVSGEVEVVV
jgi:hypothetical protein